MFVLLLVAAIATEMDAEILIRIGTGEDELRQEIDGWRWVSFGSGVTEEDHV
jgi:hypothetical protein